MTKQRATEIIDTAKSITRENRCLGPWCGQLDKLMSKEEIAEIKAFWETLPGHFSFVGALERAARKGC